MTKKLAWLFCFLLTALLALPAGAAEKKDEKNKKDKKKDELLQPSQKQLVEEATARSITEAIAAEIEARAVPTPSQMVLDLEWQLPHIDAQKFGVISKAWVLEDLVLMETNKNFLMAVNRDSGMLRWVVELEDAIRYQPSVSRNNVVVNVKNHLVALHKEAGYVRWRLLPKFMMSNTPLVIDPAVYPKQYSNSWQNLESIYVGGWDGRFYFMYVRARNTNLSRSAPSAQALIAPEFDLDYQWHITHETRGIITQPIARKDNLLYYAADDNKVYSLSRDREEREPYFLNDIPTTGVTATASVAANVTNSVLTSLYVGSRDNSLYCLDRLTLRKKWNYAAGVTPTGNIFADEAATPYVYFAAEDGQVHSVEVTPTKISRTQPEVPEIFKPGWKVEAAGIIGAGPDLVYLGTGKKGEMNAYTGIRAVDKWTGKVRWEVSGGKDSFFTQFLEYHNAWNSGAGARIYALTSDNRLVAYKEKIRDTGIKTVKLPEEPKGPVRIEGKKPPADGAAAPAEEKKPDAK